MVVLLYFDIMFKVRTSFFVPVNVLLIFAQTNEHLEKKLSPGFTFTLSLCPSTTTQPRTKSFKNDNRLLFYFLGCCTYSALVCFENLA